MIPSPLEKKTGSSIYDGHRSYRGFRIARLHKNRPDGYFKFPNYLSIKFKDLLT